MIFYRTLVIKYLKVAKIALKLATRKYGHCFVVLFLESPPCLFLSEINGRFFIVFVEVCAILPRIDSVIRQRDGKASLDGYLDQCGGRGSVSLDFVVSES